MPPGRSVTNECTSASSLRAVNASMAAAGIGERTNPPVGRGERGSVVATTEGGFRGKRLAGMKGGVMTLAPGWAPGKTDVSPSEAITPADGSVLLGTGQWACYNNTTLSKTQGVIAYIALAISSVTKKAENRRRGSVGLAADASIWHRRPRSQC